MTFKPKIEFISHAEAEASDWIVCMRWTDPPIVPGNLRGTCTLCGCAVQFMRLSPRKPQRICLPCAPSLIRPN